MPEDSDPTDPRNGLLEQFQTLGDELRAEAGQPRDIAARPRKAGDEPVLTGSVAAAKTIGDQSWSLAWQPGRGVCLRPG